LQLDRVTKKLTTPVGHSQLDASDLIYSKGAGPTAQGLAHADFDGLIGCDGHTANLIGALKRWGCALAGGE
jgi:hypothetical protein